MTDEEYDNVANTVTKLINQGWDLTTKTYAGVGHAVAEQQEFRDLPVWGLREKFWTPKRMQPPAKFKQEYEIVANAHLFTKYRIIGSQMTYDEAVALKKMMES